MRGMINMTIDNDYKNGWRYIVWTGNVDDYFKDYETAKQSYDEWIEKEFDDVWLTELQSDGGQKILQTTEEI